MRRSDLPAKASLKIAFVGMPGSTRFCVPLSRHRLRCFDLLFPGINSIQRAVHRQLPQHDDLRNTQQDIATRPLRAIR